MTAVNVVSLIVFFVICLVLFNYTPLGLCIKNLGGNPVAARQSGINTRKTTILAFLVSAAGVGIAAFIILLRTRTVGAATASSVGTDVIVALVLGGMPLSTGQIQIVRGIVFIAVVFVSSFSYRGRLLPR